MCDYCMASIPMHCPFNFKLKCHSLICLQYIFDILYPQKWLIHPKTSSHALSYKITNIVNITTYLKLCMYTYIHMYIHINHKIIKFPRGCSPGNYMHVTFKYLVLTISIMWDDDKVVSSTISCSYIHYQL